VAAAATGSLLIAFLVGTAAAALLGFASERLLLRRVSGHELREVLLTVGIALVVADVALTIFGGKPRLLEVPEALTGSTQLGPYRYPTYRLFVMLLAVAVGIGLWILEQHTPLGARIRAGVDDRETAAALGIGIDRLFAILFVLGSALAGVAGVAAAGMLTMRPGADTDILLFALVVVIVGGLGSVAGAALGSILIGLTDAFSRAWFPELSSFAVFAPMAILLVIRPRGLMGIPT
jgi:branched-chain amino acid transport system permease protein